LHALPSGHGAPSTTGPFWHAPWLHTSAVHGLLSLQSALPVHVMQPGTGVCTQPLCALQLSVVHALPSSQPSGVPA
jgi:hypothetical protein